MWTQGLLRGIIMRKGAQELKDLDVDRVDAVDRPATGRNFLLFKSEDGTQIMKGYGALATAAANVLKHVRKDADAVVAKNAAIALNGLAQVLGQDPVFVDKSVPTQPYEIKEDVDADARGPADEKLGQLFVARSGPASMVGTVELMTKAWPIVDDEPEPDADDEKKKAKAKAAKLKADAEDDEMPDADKADRGVMRSIDALTKAVAASVEVAKSTNEMIAKAIKGEVAKSEGEEDEPAVRVRPQSRQPKGDELARVRKSGGGYEPRFDVSFADVAFGK